MRGGLRGLLEPSEHLFEENSFVRGMLIEQHQTPVRFQNNVEPPDNADETERDMQEWRGWFVWRRREAGCGRGACMSYIRYMGYTGDMRSIRQIGLIRLIRPIGEGRRSGSKAHSQRWLLAWFCRSRGQWLQGRWEVGKHDLAFGGAVLLRRR